jgi:fatty-acyl-CoA synthase
LTGVGKVFKPQLRWNAAQRVFAQMLAPLIEQGIRCEVSVGAHGTHGSLATVTIKGVPIGSREAVTQQIHHRLNPFVIRHEIHWT